MPRKPRPFATAIMQLTQTFGLRDTYWILSFLSSWAIAVRHNNWEPIDAEEYGEYWAMSRAKAFRDQQKWRDLFPAELTPNNRVLAARQQYEAMAAEIGHDPNRDEFAALLATSPPPAL